MATRQDSSAPDEPTDIPIKKIVYWTVSILAYLIHGTVLVKFVAEALQITAPTFATKLSKEPIIGIIPALLPALRAVTLGHLTALIMMFAVCFFFREILRVHLDPNSEKVFEVEPYKAVVLPVGLILVGADAIFFLLGVTALSWGTVGFSFSALLVTVIVTTLHVFVALLSLRLKRAADEEEQEKEIPMKLVQLILALGAVVVIILALALGGSMQKKESPFAQDTPERVLILCIDDTGSMGEKLGSSWDMAQRTLDVEFRVASSTGRVVVGHLSRQDPVVLTGTPMQIRQKHPDFDAFRQWLQRGPMVGSRVFDGISDAIDFALALPGDAVPTLLVFSDMEDEMAGDRERLLRCLTALGQRRDAACGFYFVKRDAKFWAEAVKTRVKHSVVNTFNSLSQELPVRD